MKKLIFILFVVIFRIISLFSLHDMYVCSDHLKREIHLEHFVCAGKILRPPWDLKLACACAEVFLYSLTKKNVFALGKTFFLSSSFLLLPIEIYTSCRARKKAREQITRVLCGKRFFFLFLDVFFPSSRMRKFFRRTRKFFLGF